MLDLAARALGAGLPGSAAAQALQLPERSALGFSSRSRPSPPAGVWMPKVDGLRLTSSDTTSFTQPSPEPSPRPEIASNPTTSFARVPPKHSPFAAIPHAPHPEGRVAHHLMRPGRRFTSNQSG